MDVTTTVLLHSLWICTCCREVTGQWLIRLDYFNGSTSSNERCDPDGTGFEHYGLHTIRYLNNTGDQDCYCTLRPSSQRSTFSLGQENLQGMDGSMSVTFDAASNKITTLSQNGVHKSGTYVSVDCGSFDMICEAATFTKPASAHVCPTTLTATSITTTTVPHHQLLTSTPSVLLVDNPGPGNNTNMTPYHSTSETSLNQEELSFWHKHKIKLLSSAAAAIVTIIVILVIILLLCCKRADCGNNTDNGKSHAVREAQFSDSVSIRGLTSTMSKGIPESRYSTWYTGLPGDIPPDPEGREPFLDSLNMQSCSDGIAEPHSSGFIEDASEVTQDTSHTDTSLHYADINVNMLVARQPVQESLYQNAGVAPDNNLTYADLTFDTKNKQS